MIKFVNIAVADRNILCLIQIWLKADAVERRNDRTDTVLLRLAHRLKLATTLALSTLCAPSPLASQPLRLNSSEMGACANDHSCGSVQGRSLMIALSTDYNQFGLETCALCVINLEINVDTKPTVKLIEASPDIIDVDL